jgi:magnesium and cobalt transporter
VQDVMTPRTDADFLPSGTSILDTARFVMETGHSRIPVYADTRDNIIGVAYVKDMLPALLDPVHHSDSVDKIMRPPVFVPETKMVSQLLQEFRARKNHIAIVVDEYGGTSGIVTIEDVLEQIVGEIEDEHDKPAELDIQQLEDGKLLLSGRAWLEDLEEVGI